MGRYPWGGWYRVKALVHLDREMERDGTRCVGWLWYPIPAEPSLVLLWGNGGFFSTR